MRSPLAIPYATYRVIAIIICIILARSASAQLKLGDTIPHIILQNDKNQLVSIQSFKGNILLIDFWASWCAPCRKANQKLRRLYDKNKHDSFEIIGISFDKDLTKWRKAIEKDHLQYTQLSEPTGFDARISSIFGVESLPSSFLFNQDGRLVAMNPDEEQIKKIITQFKKHHP